MKSHKKLTYRWSGLNSKNETISGELEALSVNFAILQLQQQDIKNIVIAKKKWRIFEKIHTKISSLEIMLFFQQLASLISAGIPILQSIDILAQGQDNVAFKNILQHVKKDISIGKGFSNSLQQYPRYFNPITHHLLHAGEVSGTLEKMLHRCATYQEKIFRLRKQIQQAFFYPGIISVIALLVTLMMLLFIVPRFEELFKGIQGNLPMFTRIILFISKNLRENFLLEIFFILMCIGTIFHFKKNIHFQRKFDHWLLKTPGIKHFLQRIVIARFARSLSTLFAAGLPITDALKISAHATDNQLYIDAIQRISLEINKGQQLYQAMQISSLFPPLTISMIKIGEETGSLDTLLEKIADLYELETDHIISNLSQLLEPLIMVILGVLIGGLVIAMYLPIFKLGTII